MVVVIRGGRDSKKIESDYRLSDSNLSFEERWIVFFKRFEFLKRRDHLEAFLKQLSLILAIQSMILV